MRFYNKPRRRPTIIVVTMIDVFCVLLIFFIVATTFRKNIAPSVRITLPDVKTGASSTQADPIILSVTSQEKIYLNNKEINLVELERYFKEIGSQKIQPPVALQADTKSSFGLIIKIMEMAKTAGFEQLPAFVDEKGGSSSTFSPR
jgi:biopolymer transport protein ExbD